MIFLQEQHWIDFPTNSLMFVAQLMKYSSANRKFRVDHVFARSARLLLR